MTNNTDHRSQSDLFDSSIEVQFDVIEGLVHRLYLEVVDNRKAYQDNGLTIEAVKNVLHNTDTAIVQLFHTVLVFQQLIQDKINDTTD